MKPPATAILFQMEYRAKPSGIKGVASGPSYSEIRITSESAWIRLNDNDDWTVIDISDLDKVKHLKWYVSTEGNQTYAKCRNPSGSTPKLLRLHRLICDGSLVDHEDGDGLNNRKQNLRPACRSRNGFNRGITKLNTSGYKGVTLQKQTGKWIAQIWAFKKKHHLGLYATAEDAYEAYCKAARQLHGEFVNV